MKEIRLEKIGENKWSYLNYTGEREHNLNCTSYIEYRPEHNDYQIVITFPFLNEKGIENRIKEMEFAKQAIKKLKAKFLDGTNAN